MFKNMLKRSWLSIARKPSRSIILVLILFVMANMLLATVSIKNSVNKSMDYAKEKIGGIVYLQADTEAVREKVESARESGEQAQFTVPTISEAMAKGVADSKYIKDYTYSVVANANAGSYEVVETAQNERERQFQSSLNSAQEQVDSQVSQFNAQREQFNSQQEQANSQQSQGGGMMGPPSGGSGNRPNFNFNFNFNLADPTLGRGDTAVQGINSFDFISDVEAGNMKIIEGEKFDETTKNGVVISSELAEANNLKVGGEITFKRTSDSAEIKLTIVGIYQTSTEDFNYNTVYTNIDTAKQFYAEEQLTTLAVQNVRYYLTSASDKDAFLAETNGEYKDLASQNLKLDIDDSAYQTMVGPIEQVGSFSVTILWIVITATVAIVTLIVVINVKDRRYEMGVLLSLGAKKSNIVGQIFIELILVGTIAFGASLFTSQILAQKMGEGLLQQQVTASEQEASENESNRGANAGPGRMMMSMGGQQQTNVEQIDSIDVSAGIQEYATLFGIGYLILIVAMILPSVNVLRYQPKTILTGKE